MAYSIIGGKLGCQRIDETSTTQNHPLGLEVYAVDPVRGTGKFVYMKGVASTVVGSCCQLNMDDGTTALVDTDVADTLVGKVGFAMSINIGSQYGWYQTEGKAAGLAISGGGAADNAKVYPTSTAGQVDDVAAIGTQIIGAKFASTESAGAVDIEISNPWIGVADYDVS